ncbi:MAG: TetR/AcrR family transcriptional regulator [Thermoleophilia bacterium]|nr:TetR/AcrR family transcriptional regulator [Thermoleophilia bacterium]
MGTVEAGDDAGRLQPVDPLSELAPPAKRILKAARKVIVKEGYGSLSLQTVAGEAGELKSTIAYYFGDKAGLVASLVESLIHDTNVNAVTVLASVPEGPERVRELLKVQREVAGAQDYWRLLFGLLPEIRKDKKLRGRFADLLHWYYEIVLKSLGIWEETDESGEPELVASLVLAVLEGFALQAELAPDGYDLDARFALWESILTPYIERRVSAK